MEGIAEAFGPSFTYLIGEKRVSLRSPNFSDFAYMESRMLHAEPSLEEQARAIAELAKSDVEWSKEVCKELYQEALNRRRKVKTDELIDYCFVDPVGHGELVFRLIQTQKPVGWETITPEQIIDAVADVLMNEDERATDTVARMAEAAGVSEPENPT